MRSLTILVVGALAASCSTVGETPEQIAERDRQLHQLTAGKTAGAPANCVPAAPARDMRVIDGQTLAFRAGSRTTYVVSLSPGCGAIDNPGYSLLTRQFAGSGLCRGDIAQVVDLSSSMTTGSCSISQVVPYDSPR